MDYLKIAREAVAMYETVGDEDLVELQHLLAVVIGTKKATPELTGRLASRGIHGLITMSVQELEINGLNHQEALKVHSSLILAKKLVKQMKSPIWQKPIVSPDIIGNYLIPKMRHLKQEHLIAIYLNTKNQIVKESTIYIGGLDISILQPREIFAEALKLEYGVASVIIAHNHPSGDPKASREDVLTTKRIVKAGELLGIELLDHIIVGNDSFISLKKEGDFNNLI